MRLKPDAVLNCLHGRWGEDGCVQGILEWLDIPYSHSGVLASAVAMDKQRCKDIFRAAGLPVVESVIVAADEVRSRHVMTPPYVVKPNNEGSSVGVYLVEAETTARRSWTRHAGDGYGRDIRTGPRVDDNRGGRTRADCDRYHDHRLV